MRIAVTGGSGAIGTYVCDELIKAGHEVFCLDVRHSEMGATFREVDLMRLEDTCRAVEGMDQVVHLAAIPDPFQGDQPERVMSVNVTLSYNVFEAARLKGVKRVIYGCSESSTGFGIHHVKLVPEFVPIDEDHPLWPHETYSLSKHLGERMGANYAKAFGLEVISLRYVWVWTKRAETSAREIVARARAGAGGEGDPKDGFGAHIAVRDVARACAASSAFAFEPGPEAPFEAFFLAARNTFFPVPTLEILKANFGQCPPIRDEAYFEENPCASVFDIRKARRLLGWEPAFDWRQIEQWEF